jgi:hypothetical protein
MIAKGASRSGPRQLAVYLMRVERWDTGEPAELLELRSPWAAGVDGADRRHIADQLIEAFRDWQTLVEGTKQGRDGLYHAEISPEAHYARNMTPEQWKRAADIMAEELGLQDQPRALVLHAGTDDRPHLHVVWQRTDVDTMKVISDGYNYVAHERASMRMALEFGQEIVPGKHAKRDRKKQPEFPRAKFNQDEAQQAERQGVDIEERKKAITALRQSCDDGKAFKNALEETGYVLAKGDKRGFVLIDQDGEILSLSKQLLDIRGAAYKKFMADVDPAKLPSVDEAKALQEQRALAAKETRTSGEQQPEEAPQPEPAPAPAKKEEPPPAAQDEELEALKKAVAARQAEEARKWADLHALELRQLQYELDQEIALKLENRDINDRQQTEAVNARLKAERAGWNGIWAALQARWNPKLAEERKAAQRKELRDLKRRQERERKDYEALLQQTKELEIENLQERHRQKMVELQMEHDHETERRVREHEESRRILAEIEEQRRKLEEELKHNDSLRDGPPPPKLGK